MTRNWIVVGAFVAVLAIGGYFYFQVNKLGDFKVKLAGKKVIQFTQDRVVVDLTLSVSNDSDIDVIINSYDVDLTVNNNFVSKLKNDLSQLIRARGASDFKLILDFNPKTVLKQAFNAEFLKGLLTNKNNMLIGLKGTVSIMNGLKNIPVNISSKVSDL